MEDGLGKIFTKNLILAALCLWQRQGDCAEANVLKPLINILKPEMNYD